MVQRKVPSKVGIQAEHVKSDKLFANMKLSTSHQHQDGKSRGADMKKKMKKTRSIKLSDLEALQSSSPISPPSRRTLSQPGKPPPPLHVPTTSPSPHKQHGSPNYMKPTSSSHAKKELFPVSLRNTQPSCDFKNLPRKFSSDSKATCASNSNEKAAKTLIKSSSLSLVRTLTKTTSFKASRACSRKSTRAAMCADMNTPHRATCSSTLKDSNFPAYLMLSPGGSELEGTSVLKVCPYAYCSLNGHHHADLPPLKSFMSSRRRLLKTQKRVKLEALSPRRLKVPIETEKKDSDVEQNVFDAKPAYDEIGVEDIFIEIYANEKDAKPTGAEETDFLKEVKDQEDIKSTIVDDDGIAAGEEGVNVMQAIPSITDTPSPPISHVDLEEDLKNSFDEVAIEVDIAQDADDDHQASWSHEELSMESYCIDDGEQMGDVNNEVDDSDSEAEGMELEEELFCGFDHEKEADSSVYSEEDNDSKIESLSESSHGVSVTWLDDILSSYYEDILVDETLKEGKSEERAYLEEQPHDDGISSVLEDTSGSTETQETGYPTSDIGCDQSSMTQEIFENLTNANAAEDNSGENEKQGDDVPICSMGMTLYEETNDNSQCQEMSETCNEDRYSSQENKDDNSNKEENQVQLFDEHEESITAVEEQVVLEKDQGKGNKLQSKSCNSGEEQNTSENWKSAIRRKRGVEDDDEMRSFNPREPNFLPLVAEAEQEKVDLRHQMMDERKNAEEWMIDCALRQVVTKLAPARKKKVALLVEAFETVMPIPKCESHLRNNSAFPHSRHIQACS